MIFLFMTVSFAGGHSFSAARHSLVRSSVEKPLTDGDPAHDALSGRSDGPV